jgi:hypothetical protein
MIRTTEVVIGPLVLAVLEGRDLSWYQQRGAHEEAASLMYPLLREAGFDGFLDVGSNYGMVAMLACR